MLIVAGTVKMEPGDIAKMKDAAVEMMTATRGEDGCIEYEFSEVIGEPGTMRVFEKWESWDHLRAHFEVEHMGTWREAMKAVTVSERSISVYDQIGDIQRL